MIDFKNVDKGTVARTLILIIALVNQMLSISGHAVIPIEDEQIESLISNVFAVGAVIVSWWKNNSFTDAAIEADKVKEEIKNGNTVKVTDPSTERRENSI